jgi:hypothetical protein
MTTRQALKDMVDRIPEDSLPEAEVRLESLTSGAGDRTYTVDEAPPEDERLTDREVQALRRIESGESDATPYTREEVERLLDDASR